MAKYKLPNPEGTKLDPFAFEKQFATPLSNNSSASGVADQLEFATPVSIEEGYGGLGNSSDYLNAYNETQFREQGALELVAKGVGRTLAKAGTEVLKIPGYVGGGINAAGNELFGDGKNSMSLAVDNAWINQMESLDEGLKSLMPVHISQDIQDGNLIDKASSGAWWATQGADGAGFMLSMFVPGAATKLLGTGKALASLTEVLANTRAGKLTLNAAKALKFNNASLDIAGLADDTFHISNSFARNADGVTAALMNTTLESMAEAGDTFKQSYNLLKDKVRSGEMSDEEARSQAGSKASSVFKSNMTLLMVSNLLEQNYIWKAFDSKGESLISQVTKNGKIDFDAFDADRSIGTNFWSTTDRAAIEKGEVGAQGSGVIKEMYQRIKNPADWKAYDNYGTDELISRGHEGLGLLEADGNVTYSAFSPNLYRDTKAAFDPLKRNSPNLLASAGAGAAVAGGALYTPEENQAQAGIATKSVSELAERLKGMEGVKTLNLYETNNGDLKLDTLIIDKDKRNKGIGSNVMNEINSFADESGKRVVLTPAVKDDFQGTTSRNRLVKYYKGHGFQENKGRKKDYSISEGMIREPQKGAATPQSMGTLAAISGGANAIYNAAKNNTLGEAANYAQDAANMVGYIPTAGMMTTSDIIGGIGKAGAAATGNLDAYNANVSPYIERAGETQSQLGQQVEQAIGYGVQQAAPYVMPYVTPVYNNVMKQWEQIEATPGDANLFGFIDELNRKSNAKLFR